MLAAELSEVRPPADHHPRGRGMEAHEIEIAVRDGDASWCACTCGWTSEKTDEDVAARTWAAHVLEQSLTSSTQPTV